MYQLGARCAPGWSYSSFAIFVSVCLSVYLSVCHSPHGLGRPGSEIMAAAGTYGCFELAGLFASSLQGKPNDDSTTVQLHVTLAVGGAMVQETFHAGRLV